jgi:D-sedoheptulose 7-phosphate isomerase
MKTWLSDYLVQQQNTLQGIPLDTVEALIKTFREALQKDHQIFVCGNGGSAANASHFVTDLGKGSSDKVGRRFRCFALNDNVSWITALGNDFSYEDVFVGQLMNYGKPGDMLFVMSVSGDSPNVVKAVQWAQQHQMHTIALVGGKKGRLAQLADQVIAVNSTHYGRVEDTHMVICHLICYAFMENPDYARART